MNWLEALDEMKKGKIVYPNYGEGANKILHRLDGISVVCRLEARREDAWCPTGLFVSDRAFDWCVYESYTDINAQEAFNRLMHASGVDRLEVYAAVTQSWVPAEDCKWIMVDTFMKSKWRLRDELDN